MPAESRLARRGQLPELPCQLAIALDGGSTLAGPQAKAARAGSPPHIPRCTLHKDVQSGAVAGSPGVDP